MLSSEPEKQQPSGENERRPSSHQLHLVGDPGPAGPGLDARHDGLEFVQVAIHDACHALVGHEFLLVSIGKAQVHTRGEGEPSPNPK